MGAGRAAEIGRGALQPPEHLAVLLVLSLPARRARREHQMFDGARGVREDLRQLREVVHGDHAVVVAPELVAGAVPGEHQARELTLAHLGLRQRLHQVGQLVLGATVEIGTPEELRRRHRLLVGQAQRGGVFGRRHRRREVVGDLSVLELMLGALVADRQRPAVVLVGRVERLGLGACAFVHPEVHDPGLARIELSRAGGCVLRAHHVGDRRIADATREVGRGRLGHCRGGDLLGGDGGTRVDLGLSHGMPPRRGAPGA